MPDDDDEVDADPAAEAADPLNPDRPPGAPSGDEIHRAMLDESRSSGRAPSE